MAISPSAVRNNPYGEPIGWSLPVRARQPAGRQIVGRHEAQEADQPARQADRGGASLTRPPLTQQTGDDTESGVEAGNQIAHRRAGPHRRLIRRTVHAHEAAHRLGDEIEAGPVAIRTGGAEPGDAAAHQARVDFAQARLVEAHRGEHAGAVVVDQHITLRDQPRQDVAAFVGAQVQRDRALVAVVVGEIPGQPVPARALVAHRVALAWRLHLDDVGTKIAQQHGAERTGQHAREIEHADTGERQCDGHRRPRLNLVTGVSPSQRTLSRNRSSRRAACSRRRSSVTNVASCCSASAR